MDCKKRERERNDDDPLSSYVEQRSFNFDVTKFMSSLESLLSGGIPEGHQPSIEESVYSDDGDDNDDDIDDDDEEEIMFAQAYDEVCLFKLSLRKPVSVFYPPPYVFKPIHFLVT